MSGFDPERLERLREVMADHVDRDSVGGVAWLAARDDDVEVGVAGTPTRGEREPVRRDTIFRIASMTKPIVAVGALMLIEECRLRLEDPVEDLLPELANRRVLVDPRGPMDGDTVPAHRPITVRDVLTFGLELGMDFEAPWPQPLLEAMNGLGVGGGAPEPQVPPEPDEWMRRLSTLPLLYQPGDRWLYDTGSDVLGVLIARASGQPLDVFLHEWVFGPLGMVDTGFATIQLDRLGSCYTMNPETGERIVYDAPSGQWAKPPAFPSGGGGLVSTLDDMHAFASLLLSGGQLPDGLRLLSRASVEAMTTDHIGVDRGASGPSPDGSQGWGFGVGVQVRRAGLTRTVGSYGWDGGLGTSWANDPHERLVGVVLTTDMFTTAFPPPAAIRNGAAERERRNRLDADALEPAPTDGVDERGERECDPDADEERGGDLGDDRPPPDGVRGRDEPGAHEGPHDRVRGRHWQPKDRGQCHPSSDAGQHGDGEGTRWLDVDDAVGEQPGEPFGEGDRRDRPYERRERAPRDGGSVPGDARAGQRGDAFGDVVGVVGAVGRRQQRGERDDGDGHGLVAVRSM